MSERLLRRILVVDDEPNIVNAVRRELNTPPLGRYRYEVEGFTDPAAALLRAKEERFDAVISDYRMPGMSGMEFLKAFAAIQPNCARLVLSGQTDMDALTQMVNQTHIYRFIPKPWHDYFLKSSLAQAIEFNAALLENQRLADLVRQRNVSLPPLTGSEVDHVLLVDDEPGVLGSLSRVLASRNRIDDLFDAIRTEIIHSETAPAEVSKIEVHTAGSAFEAMKLADSQLFSCILADYRMPGMNGIDLLQQFADRQPYCARILVSGQLTQDDLITAVDIAHIFGFVAKPWQDYELKSCVAQALAYRRMTLENRYLAEMVKRAGGG